MEVSNDDFKQALRRFPSGVTIVTVKNGADIHGITVSAFISVSIDPELILVSIGKQARAHAMLEASTEFGVSILGSDQIGISNHFANWGEKTEPRFKDLHGFPVIKGSLAQLHCTKHAQHDAGDHSLFVGKVEHLDYKNGKPLIFYSGNYRRLKNLE